jgi:hypothetical protein
MKMTGWPGPVDPTRNGNAQRSGAGRGFREIDSQAGWIGRRSVVGMALPVIMIRPSTDEREAQTRARKRRVSAFSRSSATGQNHCAGVLVQGLAVACLASACSKPAPVVADGPEITGTLSVGGAPVELVRCRPGHAVNVFVEVDTTLGTLHFGDGKLSWQGSEQACQKLDRSWGGGVRRDGTTYFRGTLSFRCDKVTGDLALDCGQITPQEAAELARNRAAAKSQHSPDPAGIGPDASGGSRASAGSAPSSPGP